MSAELQEAFDEFDEAFGQHDGTPKGVVLSPETAGFLLQVVCSIQLPAAAENFEQQAALIVRAKRELSE